VPGKVDVLHGRTWLSFGYHKLCSAALLCCDSEVADLHGSGRLTIEKGWQHRDQSRELVGASAIVHNMLCCFVFRCLQVPTAWRSLISDRHIRRYQRSSRVQSKHHIMIESTKFSVVYVLKCLGGVGSNRSQYVHVSFPSVSTAKLSLKIRPHPPHPNSSAVSHTYAQLARASIQCRAIASFCTAALGFLLGSTRCAQQRCYIATWKSLFFMDLGG
jgi:hypothetical protein